MQQRPGESYRTSRVIAAALPAGVILFWAVGWFLTNGGEHGLVPPSGLAPRTAFWIWAASALVGFAGALLLRARVLQTVENATRLGGPLSTETVGQIQATLMIAWALLEAPALVAGVFFLLLAAREILWPAAVLYLLGVAITFPRPEWFGTD